MQNDALRFCYIQLLDKISIQRLHKRVKLSSSENRRIIQLLGLQILLYQRNTDRHITCNMFLKLMRK